MHPLYSILTAYLALHILSPPFEGCLCRPRDTYVGWWKCQVGCPAPPRPPQAMGGDRSRALPLRPGRCWAWGGHWR